MSLQLAFRSDLPELLEAPERLRAAGVVQLDFRGAPTDVPVVLAWMPAASLFFHESGWESVGVIDNAARHTVIA